MKNNLKIIAAFILGLIVATTIGVSATILYNANEVGFEPSNPNWNVTNIEEALNYLYNHKESSGSLTGIYWNFPYSGNEQVFDVPESGTYKLEVWGAQGGSYSDTYYGGYGSYSVGNISLNKGESIYVYVGRAGQKSTISGINPGGYNGGGDSYVITSACSNFGGSGGGATHIAKVSKTLDQLGSYKGEYIEANKTYNSSDILIVAGGGGGALYRYCTSSDYMYVTGGSAGGKDASNNYTYQSSWNIDTGTPAGQNNAGTGGSGNYEAGAASGSFGKGAKTSRTGGYTNSPGGGGGFYGGGASMFVGSGGGSGFIGNPNLTNKHMTCFDCEVSEDEHIKTRRVNSNTDVSETAIADYAKKGNGYAKITYLGN